MREQLVRSCSALIPVTRMKWRPNLTRYQDFLQLVPIAALSCRRLIEKTVPSHLAARVRSIGGPAENCICPILILHVLGYACAIARLLFADSVLVSKLPFFADFFLLFFFKKKKITE